MEARYSYILNPGTTKPSEIELFIIGRIGKRVAACFHMKPNGVIVKKENKEFQSKKAFKETREFWRAKEYPLSVQLIPLAAEIAKRNPQFKLAMDMVERKESKKKQEFPAENNQFAIKLKTALEAG